MLFATDTAESGAFREEVRHWVEASLPREYRSHVQVLDPRILRDWQRRLHERGWVAPHWPKEWGGMGATLDEQLILIEELARAGAPYLVPTGLNFLGQAIMAFGTPAQQRYHLPRILSGEIFWAQGYSEPEAGSDLASLSTRAEDAGGHFVVTGRKIWSSYAHFCDWMFALVRTDPKARPRQSGISMLLIDMRSPGISVRAIRTITGQDEFAEVTLDAVEVPKANLLGPLNGGWKVANHVLGFERLSNGSPRNALIAWQKVHRAARASGRADSAEFRDRMALAEIRLVAHIALYRDAVNQFKRNQPIDDLAPVLKISSTELLQNMSDLLIEACAEHGGSLVFDCDPGDPLEVGASFLLSRRATIYGGSSEIQRNIIAQRVLGFPRPW